MDIWIRSTLDPRTQAAACLVTWGPAVQALITPEVAFTTGRDLMAAAAHAEADIAFLQYFRDELKADLQTVGQVMRDIRARRPTPTGQTALRIEAVAGANTGLPYVHIARGSMKGQLSPDEAREMALHWTQTAAAAQIDVRLRYALGEWDHLAPADIERLFSMVQATQR